MNRPPETHDALVVEDNPDDVWLVARVFKKHAPGATLAFAQDGAEALRMLLGPDALRPRFVLLDLNLPKAGGREVLRALRADPDKAKTPVILFTTKNEDPDEFAADPHTATLSKPPDIVSLREALHRIDAKVPAIDSPGAA